MTKHICFISSFFLVACATQPQVHQPASIVTHHHGLGMVRAPGSADANGVSPQAYCDALDKNNGNTDNPSADQIAVIVSIMAEPAMRLHHALWHAVRGGATAQQIESIDQANNTTTWADFHAYCPIPGAFAANGYNPVGEDFLYMHRNMINELRAGFQARHLPCIKPWTTVPTPGTSFSSTVWPMTDKVTTGPKSKLALARLQAWDSKLQNSVWLASHSLSEVGFALELTVHNNLHMRFATAGPPPGFAGAAPVSFDNSFPAGWNFDKPEYNWLADPYGAAVNPVFWKIHGYVDSIIDLWMTANHKTSISENCSAGDNSCYQWQGKWEGVINLQNPPVGAAVQREGLAHEAIGQPDKATAELTKRRMQIQNIGVLKDEDLAPKTRAEDAALPEDPDLDPFLFAQKQFTSGANCSP